jgi:uncharacterized protein (TIGR03067 family)
MKRRLLLLLPGILLVSAAAAKEDQADREKIQGVWRVIAAADGGKPEPEERMKDRRLLITRDTITVQDGEKTVLQWAYNLGPSENPKALDLTELREGRRGKTGLGIYELKGDDLKICFPEDREGQRSTRFESKPNSVNDILITLRREKR